MKYFTYFLNPFSTYINGTKVISMSRYISNIREEILNFKLRNYKEISKLFILSIFNYPRLLSDLAIYDYIAYVPMDKNKEKYVRGYNQAKIIAEELSVFTGIPVLELLEKVKRNKTQSSVKRTYRAANVRGVYRVRENVNIKKETKILLVDDIFTTGSTIFEIKKILLEKYNNIKVDAFILSKTINIKKEETSVISRKHKYYSLKNSKKRLRKKDLEARYK